VCILPFPALIQIGERRLRVAVCGVYALASVAIIVSAVRAALLGVNPQSNIKYIMTLTMIEVATCVVVGCLPCISSTFTRKYVYSSRGFTNSSNRGGTAAYNGTGRSSTFKQQDETHMESIDLSTAKDGVIGTSYVSQCSYGVEGPEHVHPEQIRETTTVRVMVS
jgi:hypothetical protein